MTSSDDLSLSEEFPRRLSLIDDDLIPELESNQTSCSSTAAQETALGIYEIFDMILDRLPSRDLLILQLTGKSVRDHILESSTLQRKLGFSAIPRPVGRPAKAARFISGCPYFVHEFVSIKGTRCGVIAIPDLPKPESTAHESWRQMIPFDPAPKAIVLHHRGDDLIIIPRSSQFVTLGMLYEVCLKYSSSWRSNANRIHEYDIKGRQVVRPAFNQAAWISSLMLPSGVFHYPQKDRAVDRIMARPDIEVEYLGTCVIYRAPRTSEHPHEQLTDGANYYQTKYDYKDGCLKAYKHPFE